MPSLIFPNSTAEAKKLALAVQKGDLTRIRRGIYTDAAYEEIPSLLHNRWYEVVAYLFGSDSLIAYRTACELKPSQGLVFIVADVQKRRRVVVGGSLAIEVLPGNPSQGREPFLGGMCRSNLARQCLENLVSSRSSAAISKTLGVGYVEQQLCRELSQRGEQRINWLRDEARQLARPLELEQEFERLSKIVSALLSTHNPDSGLA